MTDELLELSRMRADLPPADEAAMARARGTLIYYMAESVPAQRRRFPRQIAATAVVGAAAVAAFLIMPSVGDNAPVASAVTLNGDGTVTIDLTDITNMPAANDVLKGAGIRAEVVGIQDARRCEPGVEPAPPLPWPDDLILDQPHDERNILTFRPEGIPGGAKLMIFATLASSLTWATVPGATLPHVVGSAQLYPENSGTCVDDSSGSNDVYSIPAPGAGN
jgi:hypothetical protein